MKNQFTEMTQIGICVRNLENTMQNMKKIFGVDPNFVGETLKVCRKYKGNDGNFMAKIALYDFCNIQFEFIQSIEGESIWKDFIDEHGEGIQHVSFRVNNFDAASEQMKNVGIEPVQQGLAMARPIRWDFWGTENLLGFSIESSSVMEYPEQHPKYPF